MEGAVSRIREFVPPQSTRNGFEVAAVATTGFAGLPRAGVRAGVRAVRHGSRLGLRRAGFHGSTMACGNGRRGRFAEVTTDAEACGACGIAACERLSRWSRRACGVGMVVGRLADFAADAAGLRRGSRRTELGGCRRIWRRGFRRAQAGGGGRIWRRGFRRAQVGGGGRGVLWGGGNLQSDLNY
jgi:hypothetical protein